MGSAFTPKRGYSGQLSHKGAWCQFEVDRLVPAPDLVAQLGFNGRLKRPRNPCGQVSIGLVDHDDADQLFGSV